MIELFSIRENNTRGASGIMFKSLSEEAKRKALEHACISTPKEKHWDVLPIAFIHESMNLESQKMIDDEALSQIGYCSSRSA